MSTSPKNLIEDLLGACTADDLFTREEARSLLRAVRAEAPEQLQDNIEKVVAWARAVRFRQTLLDLVLRLGAVDAIGVRPGADGDVEVALEANVKLI